MYFIGNQFNIPSTKKSLPRIVLVSNVEHDGDDEDFHTRLLPKHLKVQMWQQMLESYSSEEAARMIAMDNATENAKEIIKELKLEFNKARQAAITTEMLEIVGGAEALVD